MFTAQVSRRVAAIFRLIGDGFGKRGQAKDEVKVEVKVEVGGGS